MRLPFLYALQKQCRRSWARANWIAHSLSGTHVRSIPAFKSNQYDAAGRPASDWSTSGLWNVRYLLPVMYASCKQAGQGNVHACRSSDWTVWNVRQLYMWTLEVWLTLSTKFVVCVALCSSKSSEWLQFVKGLHEYSLHPSYETRAESRPLVSAGNINWD